MKKLDYYTSEPPIPASATGVVYWTAFALGAFVGLIIANILDNWIHLRRMGHPSDGGATILSILGIPAGAILAAIIRYKRKPKPVAWPVAVICGLLSAPFTIVLLYGLYA